jgi:hypothetical protein
MKVQWQVTTNLGITDQYHSLLFRTATGRDSDDGQENANETWGSVFDADCEPENKFRAFHFW